MNIKITLQGKNRTPVQTWPIMCKSKFNSLMADDNPDINPLFEASVKDEFEFWFDVLEGQNKWVKCATENDSDWSW